MSALTMTPSERERFLAEPHVAVIAIERVDQAPLAVPIWYRRDEVGDIEVWIERGSLKERHLRASGRFTLTVQKPSEPYSYVAVDGPARIREHIESDDVRPIVARYVAADEVDAYLADSFNDRAILVSMRPTHWYTADFAKETV